MPKQRWYWFVLAALLVGVLIFAGPGPALAQDEDGDDLDSGFTEEDLQTDKIYKKLPPHKDKVFITKDLPPQGAKYESVADIKVSKGFYGSEEWATEALAERARELGADAVFAVQTGFEIAPFSWASPYGSGKAVKLTNKDALKFDKLKGGWH